MLRRAAAAPHRRAGVTASPYGAAVLEDRVGAILFADVVGLSRITDDHEMVAFFLGFLGAVAALLEESEHRPLVRNTWGDGLYLVFGTVREAGLFALRLCAAVEGPVPIDSRVPGDLSVRVALHAGPLLSFRDPVTGQHTLSGTHVTRAARIEPITPPGVVYASREFAALAAAERVTEFACHPVGRVRLAKGHAVAPLFALQDPGTATASTPPPPLDQA